MPFIKVGTGVYADVGGNFVASGTVTLSLESKYAKMVDNCGASSLSSTADGVYWGASGGTDCSTPGKGGAGNTHSSRTGLYEITTVAYQASLRLPTNAWLKKTLTANMNINKSCNAYWSSGTINHYRSGNGCRNTGELAGVFVHEWGHGMDANDLVSGVSYPGEGIADMYAALRLGKSCTGRGFYTNQVCSGNGDPCKTCTGVRDIDYLQRSSGNPHTYTWSNSKCSSVHCLGVTYAEAIWSLWKRELPKYYGYDDTTSLEVTTFLTYKAAGMVQTWFSGSPPNGGCGGTSGYMSFLAADDDNGNLNDGTPRKCLTILQECFLIWNETEYSY